MRTEKQRTAIKTLKIVLLLSALLPLTACTDYWWHRSQPPSVETLLSRAESKLAASIGAAPASRQDVAGLAKTIETELRATYNILDKGKGSVVLNPDRLDPIETALINLDSKLAVTSRAPYGELCGEFRRFKSAVANRQRVDPAPFGLFSARTISFLASDLTLAPPVAAADPAAAPAAG